MREELRAATPWRITTCSRDDLASNSDLAIGALAITPQHAIEQVDPLFPKDRPVVPVSFSTADEHLKRILELPEPSTDSRCIRQQGIPRRRAKPSRSRFRKTSLAT